MLLSLQLSISISLFYLFNKAPSLPPSFIHAADLAVILSHVSSPAALNLHQRTWTYEEKVGLRQTAGEQKYFCQSGGVGERKALNTENSSWTHVPMLTNLSLMTGSPCKYKNLTQSTIKYTTHTMKYTAHKCKTPKRINVNLSCDIATSGIKLFISPLAFNVLLVYTSGFWCHHSFINSDRLAETLK